jgi:hypothetical protein
MQRLLNSMAIFLGILLVLGFSSHARAAFHLFQIGQVYSNASGTVQFVELFTDQTGQNFVNDTQFKSNTHSFQFPSALTGDTTKKHFILATPGYFALQGVPPADFELPVNNFFSTTGDTLTLNFATFPSLTFTSGQLPTDGIHSLNRAYLGSATPPPTTFTVALNSPTNFAGTAGFILPKAGDMNLDGHVDAADIKSMLSALANPSSFASTQGLTVAQLTTVGDVNKDGKFNNADVQSLIGNLKSGKGSATAVPEPLAIALAAVAGAFMLKWRRRFDAD